MQITFAIKTKLSVTSYTMLQAAYNKYRLKAKAQDNPGVIAL